jgi:hypothetical protein
MSAEDDLWLVPLEVMTDEELDTEIQAFERLAADHQAHAEELERYKADRRAAGMGVKAPEPEAPRGRELEQHG